MSLGRCLFAANPEFGDDLPPDQVNHRLSLTVRIPAPRNSRSAMTVPAVRCEPGTSGVPLQRLYVEKL
jgi:hypothetical protein